MRWMVVFSQTVRARRLTKSDRNMDYQTGLYFLNFLTVVFSVNDNFYAVHLDSMSFENAQESCNKDAGYLTNMPNTEEISKILTAIRDKGDHSSTNFWIGLKKNKTGCVHHDLPLRGFYWTIDNNNSTIYGIDKWKDEPELTCTNVLCGLLSVEYKADDIVNWGLAASRCKQKYPFICKHDGPNNIKPCAELQIHASHDIIKKNKDPYTLQITCSGNTFTLTCSKSSHEWKLVGGTDTDISEICLECQKGYKRNVTGTCEDINECEEHGNICKHLCTNTHGSYECYCLDDIGNFQKEDSIMCKRTEIKPSIPSPPNDMEGQNPPTTNRDSNSTAGSGVHTEEGTKSLYILVPVVVTLLILVVLIVIIAAMTNCYCVRRSKKRARRRAKASKEAVALNGSDSVEKVNEKEAKGCFSGN